VALIREKDRQLLEDKYRRELEGKVRLVYFTQGENLLHVPGRVECEQCKEMEELLQEVATLSPQFELVTYDFVADQAKAAEYGIDRIPALVLEGEDGSSHGVRFFGITSGYEFATLVEDLVDVSKGRSRLSEASQTKAAQIDRPVHIQIFVTPT
jgi:alkyl hydroperoxide reductase subunit AhpF